MRAVLAELYSNTCTPVQVAVTRGTPIMSDSWITECWERREDPQASATKGPLSEHKQLPFTGATMALFGFSPSEKEEMKEIAAQNGECQQRDISASNYYWEEACISR